MRLMLVVQEAWATWFWV